MKIITKRSAPTPIPIVPMLDILTILLIFFVVHTQWKTPTSTLNVDLPQVSRSPEVAPSSSRQSIRVSADGRIDLLGQIIPVANLEASLIKLKKENPAIRLDLEADRKLPLESLMQVWSAMSRAGFPIKDSSLRLQQKAAPAN